MFSDGKKQQPTNTYKTLPGLSRLGNYRAIAIYEVGNEKKFDTHILINNLHLSKS